MFRYQYFATQAAALAFLTHFVSGLHMDGRYIIERHDMAPLRAYQITFHTPDGNRIGCL